MGVVPVVVLGVSVGLVGVVVVGASVAVTWVGCETMMAPLVEARQELLSCT